MFEVIIRSEKMKDGFSCLCALTSTGCALLKAMMSARERTGEDHKSAKYAFRPSLNSARIAVSWLEPTSSNRVVRSVATFRFSITTAPFALQRNQDSVHVQVKKKFSSRSYGLNVATGLAFE
jgi:hypothetical protein